MLQMLTYHQHVECQRQHWEEHKRQCFKIEFVGWERHPILRRVYIKFTERFIHGQRGIEQVAVSLVMVF